AGQRQPPFPHLPAPLCLRADDTNPPVRTMAKHSTGATARCRRDTREVRRRFRVRFAGGVCGQQRGGMAGQLTVGPRTPAVGLQVVGAMLPDVERRGECGFAYDVPAAPWAAGEIRAGAAELAAFLADGTADLAARREPARWSPLEGACHVRDMLLVQRERPLAAR